MEPSVGQRTGRTWVFVSVLSVRRFFPPQTVRTRVQKVLTGCQRVYRNGEKKRYTVATSPDWSGNYGIYASLSQKVKAFLVFFYHEKALRTVGRTFSRDISCTVFHCPAVVLQLDWVSTKTWYDFEFAQLSQSLFHNCLWHLLLPSKLFLCSRCAAGRKVVKSTVWVSGCVV